MQLTDFYKKLSEMLQQDGRLVLMLVIANEGSSPGRKGFKMIVSGNQMFGTIGGGIMEHKLVEYARNLLKKEAFLPFAKKQIHDKSAFTDQSGMICSGWQTIAFYDISTKNLPLFKQFISENGASIIYTNNGINTSKGKHTAWEYIETNSLSKKVYIIGGGHVGLALSEVLSRLDFEIHILDNRENLNTITGNNFAHYRTTVAFEQIHNFIPEGKDSYVVIMSFGYRTDDIVIRRLIPKDFGYIGMMGSREKINMLYKNLLADGFSQFQIDKIDAPIGIDIKSETTQEIAISVAAKLIKIKNLSR